MATSIDTPHGPYEPQVPPEEEMDRAAEVMAEAVEAIAEVSHDQWAKGRIADGWRYGPQRDDEKKLHPDLVPYDDLPEGEKLYDRNAAKAIVAELMRRGILR